MTTKTRIEWQDIVDFDTALELLGGKNELSILDRMSDGAIDSRAHGMWLANEREMYVGYRSILAHRQRAYCHRCTAQEFLTCRC
jgi:hypothetical protein